MPLVDAAGLSSISTMAPFLSDATWLMVDGEVFKTRYLRQIQPGLHADDVVIEAENGEGEIDFTASEFVDAKMLEHSTYLLKSGVVIRFLNQPTIH
jgi:6-phosphogluconate dehydrogenase (decarboxylating)